MTTVKSGNGVKVAKVVTEVLNIINNPNMKRVEKLEILKLSDFTGRPGIKIAEELFNDYYFKFRWFTDRKSTGKAPRGMEAKKADYYTPFELLRKQRNWINSFEKHLKNIAPDVYVSIYDLQTKYNAKGMKLKPFACEIRKNVIEQQAIKTIEYNQKKDFVQLSGLSANFYGKEKGILEVQENKASNSYNGVDKYCVVNGHYITVTQSESTDWNAYSKGWHNSHGPKRTIDSREVNFYNDGKIKYSIEVKTFAGNYLIDAIIEGQKILEQKIKGLAKVQLNKHFSVILIRKVLNVEIFERKLGDAQIDFCALYKNETFHAATISATIAGLQKKLKANIYFDREKINKELGFELGFCETGIKEFCTDNNLNFDSTYSRKYLRNIVIANRSENCKKYASELKKIGIALNCK